MYRSWFLILVTYHNLDGSREILLLSQNEKNGGNLATVAVNDVLLNSSIDLSSVRRIPYASL